MMRILLLLLSLHSIAFSQSDPVIYERNNFIGKWELLYHLELDTNDLVTDTVYSSVKMGTGLIIEKDSVDEYLLPMNTDSIMLMDMKGSWHLREYRNKTNIVLKCGGIFLCSDYQVMSLVGDLLILKSWSKSEDYELVYLKRKN